MVSGLFRFFPKENILRFLFLNLGENFLYYFVYRTMYQTKKHLQIILRKCLIFSSPGWARTSDPLINSQML